MIRDGTVGVGLLALLALLMVVVGVQTTAAADAVVGTGTPESCTEAAFDSALAIAQADGGGTVTFNCGGPATIGLTSTKWISTTVAIIATEPITFDGNSVMGIFFVDGRLEIDGLTLTNTSADPAIRNYGHIEIRNSTIKNHSSQSNISAIVNENTAWLTITDSLLTENHAYTASTIDNYGQLTIIDSAITNNSAATFAGAIYNQAWMTATGSLFEANSAGLDGAIANGEHLVIHDSVFRNNTASAGHGALSSGGVLTITDSLFEGNRAPDGGAIDNISHLFIRGTTFRDNGMPESLGGAIGLSFIRTPYSATIESSQFISNSGRLGGAIYSSDIPLTITDSLVVGNQATQGGGIYVREGRLVLSNSAIISNSATISGGGGIYGGAWLRLTNATISGNSGDGLWIEGAPVTITHTTIADNLGAGLHNGVAHASNVTVANSIIAGNGGGACTGGQLTALTGTLWDDASCAATSASGNQPNTDPQLAPLALLDNTLAHMPAATSPAIDAAACHIHVSHDQRRLARPQGWACDLGAIETTIIKERIFLPAILR